MIKTIIKKKLFDNCAKLTLLNLELQIFTITISRLHGLYFVQVSFFHTHQPMRLVINKLIYKNK